MAQASLGAAAAALVAAEQSSAATASLLAVRRPLEAFLRTGTVQVVDESSNGSGDAPGPSDVSTFSPCPTTTKRRRMFGEKMLVAPIGVRQEGGHTRGSYDSQRRFVAGVEEEGRDGEVSKPAAAQKRSRGAGGGKREVNATAGVGDVAELVEVLLPRCIVPLFEAAAGVRGEREGEGGGERGRREMKKGSLACLQALLEVCRGRLASAGAALDALRR